MAYKFHSEDSGFCRFYYRNEKRQLFCYQPPYVEDRRAETVAIVRASLKELEG